MDDIYKLEGGNHANPVFDPCQFLLREREIYNVRDLTGRENHYEINANDLLDSLGEIKPVQDEEDAQDVENRELAEWIERAEYCDEYQTNDKKYFRVS